MLIATNFFGQNTPAIAATEAQYAEYWAQDAAAMYGYAASSAAAAQLTPFAYPDQHPHQTTNPAGLIAQNAAVTQANAGAAASNSLAQTAAVADPSLQALFTALDPSSLFYIDLTVFDEIRVVGTAINGTAKLDLAVCGVIGAEDNLGMLPKAGAAAAEVAPALTAPQLSSAASGIGGGASLGNVSATLASAGRLGSMSVPTSWAFPSNGAITALSEGGLPGMPGGTVSRPTGVIPRYGRRIIAVMGHPPAAG
jgi:PPE-repeat protein